MSQPTRPLIEVLAEIEDARQARGKRHRARELLLARRSPGIRRQGGTARDAGASSGPNRR